MMMKLFRWKIYRGLIFNLADHLKIAQTKKKIVKNLQDEREDSRMVGFAGDDEKSPGLAEYEGHSQHINIDMVVVDSKCGL